jgi:excisionase family DNA binding protein
VGEDRDIAQDTTQDTTQDRVTIQEAAQRLGVKEDAIRKRIQRGSLRHEKAEDGRVYVWVDATQDTTQDADESAQDATRDTAQDARIEDLREQIAYLRRQLDEEREARRRADFILGQLSQANAEQARTIREIEAPAAQEPTEAAEAVEEEPETVEPQSDTAGPQEATERPQATEEDQEESGQPRQPVTVGAWGGPQPTQRMTLRGLRRRIFGR